MGSLLEGFDWAILRFLNGHVGQSPTFDAAVLAVSSQTLLKGGLIMAFVWWLWHRKAQEPWEQRGRLLACLTGGLASIFVARIAAAALPFRVRPILQPEQGLKVVPDLTPEDMLGWSAFPSDHAALFFALAVGLLAVSRGVGIVALVHAVVVISFPRVYLGLHHPTDILGGAVIGCGMAMLCQATWPRALVTKIGRAWETRHPASFYATLFLLTFEIAELFSAVREIAVQAWHALHQAMPG